MSTSTDVPFSIDLTEPVGPASAYQRPRVYDCIPKLGPKFPGDDRPSLLPKHGGIVGFVYIQIPVEFHKALQDRGWLDIFDAKTYTIEGPSGSLDMRLMCKGAQIRGLEPTSSKRQCYIPLEYVCLKTGFDPRTGRAPEEKLEEETFTPPPPPSLDLTPEELQNAQVSEPQGAQAQEGPARVQGGDTPQREPERPEGDEPQAGPSHRPERSRRQPKTEA